MKKFFQFRKQTGIQLVKGKFAKFTLVELLVVIAIIAILAAMLIPAHRQARKTVGARTVCPMSV